MFYNYLKIALRQLAKNKLYVLINTLGMGIAVASAMTAYLLVAYNIEFDSTVDKKKVKNIVKVIHHRKNTSGDQFKELVTPFSLGPAAIHDVAGLKRFTRYCSDGAYLSYGDKGFHETIFFADAPFVDMFNPTVIKGSAKSFSGKNTILISEKFASRYFGKEDPINKEMNVSFNGRQLSVTVGAVLKDFPFNSTFTANVLMRVEHYVDQYKLEDNDWKTDHTASLLFELDDINKASAIGSQLKKYVNLSNTADPEAGSDHYELVPFMENISPNDVRRSDLHLRIPFIALGVFMSLGGIILLIACFNLTNTTLALSMRRLKEIGIRKVAGSNRSQIVIQFFCEILLTVSLAVVAGFGLSLYLIPEFAAMWELSFGLKELSGINMCLALLIILFGCALLAGVYPAVFSSRQSPVALFRGDKSAGGTNLFTRSLLVIQFALCTIVLIAGTVFTRNAAYQDTIDFGYDKDMIITALVQGPHEAEALRHAIADNPKIITTSPSIHHFAFINAPQRPAVIGDNKFNATVYDVGADYFSTVGLTLMAGRNFDQSDTTGRHAIIVDQYFVEKNQLKDPLETQVDIEGTSYSIVGIVSNHLTDLESNRSEYYAYRLADPKNYQIMLIRAEAASIEEAKAYVDQQWKKIYPGKPMRTDLQKDIVYLEANMYNKNLSKIFFFMTVLGCILSVSGLYAMASLNLHRRTKEIGVRKVLGASIANILNLINREFGIILFIAAIIGGIGGFYFTDAMLASLSRQRISVGIVTVIAGALSIVVIGLISTSLTIWKTASSNPVDALRT